MAMAIANVKGTLHRQAASVKMDSLETNVTAQQVMKNAGMR